MDIKKKKLISFVIPVFNERENISQTISDIVSVMKDVHEKYEIEIIFTDNHSFDGTYEKIVEQGQHWSEIPIKAVRFSRNIGYQLSILNGYRLAAGDCAVQLDGDLQDPPSLVLKFLQKWEEGYDVVYGIRKIRKESFVLTFLRKVFYRLMNKIGDDKFPVDAGDFRLVDRKILRQLEIVEGCDIYIRGIIGSMGFNQIGVPYDRLPRTYGESKFTNTDLTRLALSGIFGHSDFPLKLARYISGLISLITIMLALGYVVGKLMFREMIPPGFTTTTVLILFSLSIITFILSIIGEYLLRISRRLNNQSQGIVEMIVTNQD